MYGLLNFLGGKTPIPHPEYPPTKLVDTTPWQHLTWSSKIVTPAHSIKPLWQQPVLDHH